MLVGGGVPLHPLAVPCPRNGRYRRMFGWTEARGGEKPGRSVLYVYGTCMCMCMWPCTRGGVEGRVGQGLGGPAPLSLGGGGVATKLEKKLVWKPVDSLIASTARALCRSWHTVGRRTRGTEAARIQKDGGTEGHAGRAVRCAPIRHHPTRDGRAGDHPFLRVLSI